MKVRFFLSVLMCIAGLHSVAAFAQVYKWVDANGKVTFSDTPPPDGSARVETKNYGGSDNGVSASFPYELAQATRSMPVTLYTSINCAPCNEGKTFLKQNGIPFAEKTVSTNADVKKLTALVGNTQMPVLTIGSTKLIGYNLSEWRNSLTLAGYPESNMLPSDYSYPAAQPTAPVETAQKPADPTPVATPSKVPDRDPNGFQF